jgi:hypothetical protein
MGLSIAIIGLPWLDSELVKSGRPAFGVWLTTDDVGLSLGLVAIQLHWWGKE